MGETYEIRISSAYAGEHEECSGLPGTVVNVNGRGVLLRLTLGELHELRDRAYYHSDPDLGRESGMTRVTRSAAKTCEQLKRAGLWDLAGSPEAKAAFRAEWDARHADVLAPRSIG